MSNEQQNSLHEETENQGDIRERIEDVLLKALKSVQGLIDQEIAQKLKEKFEEIGVSQTSIVEMVEYLVFTLINQINQLSHAVSIDINRQDYEVLQNAAQRSQAQVRKHIRIEQQLKIYMDGLEDKIEDMEKRLKIQENKYMQLYESMKSMDVERKDALRKLARYEQRQKQKKSSNQRLFDIYKSKGSHIASKLITEQSIYKDYFVPKTKSRQSQISSNSKQKNLIDKINERSKRLNEHKKNLKYVDEHNEVNIDPSQIQISKKSSMDYGQKHNSAIASKDQRRGKDVKEGREYQSYQPSIRQLTKTVQMKPEKRPNRKIIKNRTEASQLERKDNRSNSVCN